MQRSLTDDAPAILETLVEPNARFARRYPGEPEARQPVHVVYGGAQIFHADVAESLGRGALEALEAWAPDPFTFARALGMSGADTLPTKKKRARRLISRVEADPAAARASEPAAWLAVTVYARVREKLRREPVEDFRIDFEDGYGVRPDAEEDAAAVRAAEEVTRGMLEATLPPFIGLRIKPLNEENKERSVRTLDLFFSTLAAKTGGALPPWICVTLPKVPVPEQVGALVALLDRLEQRLGIAPGAIKVELMIELTQSIFDADGSFLLPRLVHAAGGRCVGAHFGTYDYTASCNITAAHQTMAHAACQNALALMKIAYANSGIVLSDGGTNLMPVPLHRGEDLTKAQQKENRRAVHGAWATSYRHVRQSLVNGYYQGWDLHPAQLPVRYAATFAYFLESFEPAAARLAAFVDKAAQATLVGDVFDDAATGQGLLGYFLRALNAGAVTQEELAVTGLTIDEIQTRSFAKILEGRTRRGG